MSVRGQEATTDLFREPAARRSLWLALALIAVFEIPAWMTAPPGLQALRLATFDLYQRLDPRERQSAPALIVAIDEASIAARGQWPWPRSTVAELIDKITAARPAAIGVDIIFPEPDRISPEHLAGQLAAVDPELAKRLEALPGNDARLAQSIARSRVALGFAGLEQGPRPAADAPASPSLQRGGDARAYLRRYPAVLRSLPSIDRAAAGHGVLSADAEYGVVRRMPLAATVASTLVPTLGIEVLRLATGAPAFEVRTGSRGVEGVGVGDVFVPTQPDGRLFVHFGRSDPRRMVSAIDVLEGRVGAQRLESKIILLGVTGLGLVDVPTTALGERVPGIEIHAQLIENVYDGSLLWRPAWAGAAEGLALLGLGWLVAIAVPRSGPRAGVTALIAALTALLLAGYFVYHEAGLLFDPAIPGLGIVVVSTAVLAVTLGQANIERRRLALRLQEEREAAARLAGELDAARRIQMGFLPRPEEALAGEWRVAAGALMLPARKVGGDLYDFFKADDDHLFFIIGDVSGKGLNASIFMAVVKALAKSAALRGTDSVEHVFKTANAEVSRENPEAMFVTAFAGLLNLKTGRLVYCNAGHEPPLLLREGTEPLRLVSSGGPPLCVLEDYQYGSAEHWLAPGQTLCLVTDGVTEAMNVGGELYGAGRLSALLTRLPAVDPVMVVNEIETDVAEFARGAEPADDLTVLALQWRGPAA